MDCISNNFTYLGKMLIGEDIATGISGVDDDNGHSVVIHKTFNIIKIHLPIPMGEEVEMADLDAAESGSGFVHWETGPREQDVGVGVGQDSHHGLDRLRASAGYKHIVG